MKARLLSGRAFASDRNLNTTMKSEILKRWESAPNYTGEDFSDYYVVASLTRDSNVYEVANFIGIASYLIDKEPQSDSGWIIARFDHWKHGYLYCILVHEKSLLVALCEALVIAMREYPFDEDILTECEELLRTLD